MEKIITIRIPEGLERQIEEVIKLGMFKDKSEFIRFSILKVISDIKKEEYYKRLLEEINMIREKLNKENKLLSDEEIVKIIKTMRK